MTMGEIIEPRQRHAAVKDKNDKMFEDIKKFIKQNSVKDFLRL